MAARLCLSLPFKLPNVLLLVSNQSLFFFHSSYVHFLCNILLLTIMSFIMTLRNLADWSSYLYIHFSSSVVIIKLHTFVSPLFRGFSFLSLNMTSIPGKLIHFLAQWIIFFFFLYVYIYYTVLCIGLMVYFQYLTNNKNMCQCL